MFFYQLGKMILALPSERLHFPYESEWGGKTQTYLMSPQRGWSRAPYLSKTQNVTIRGYLVPGEEEILLQRYRQLVGIPTSIIGYAFDSCGEDIVWWQNTGILKNVEPAASDEPREPLTASLTLEFGTYWRPLDPILWGWGVGFYNDLQIVSAPTVYEPATFPSAAQLFNSGCKEPFVKHPFDDFTFVYDPDYWLSWGQGEQVFAHDWGQAGEWFEIHVDPARYAAPLQSLYGFTNLGTTGTITVRVVRTDPPWNRITEETFFDLATTNSRLAAKGYTGLQPTDIVIFGETPKRPGHIIRNGAILNNVHPEVTYRGLWPGMLTPGANRFMVIADTDVEVAWRHVVRRL